MKYEKGTFATVPVGVIKGIDPLAQVVFMWMCMHMNGEGVCFPSIGLLSAECGIKSRRTVQQKVNFLEEIGLLIKTSRFSGNKQTSNEYQIIIGEKEETNDRGALNAQGEGCNECTEGVQEMHPRGAADAHKTITNELNPENDIIATPGAAGQENEINKIFEIFYLINPTINFGNITNRKAVEAMIKRFGFDQTKRTAEYAIQVQGKEYAPTITTPYQLKEKLAQLKIYFEKSKQPQKGGVTILS